MSSSGFNAPGGLAPADQAKAVGSDTLLRVRDLKVHFPLGGGLFGRGIGSRSGRAEGRSVRVLKIPVHVLAAPSRAPTSHHCSCR